MAEHALLPSPLALNIAKGELDEVVHRCEAQHSSWSSTTDSQPRLGLALGIQRL